MLGLEGKREFPQARDCRKAQNHGRQKFATAPNQKHLTVPPVIWPSGLFKGGTSDHCWIKALISHAIIFSIHVGPIANLKPLHENLNSNPNNALQIIGAESALFDVFGLFAM